MTSPGPVLILGGYGNFGKRIAERLVASNVPVIIAGRNLDKARDRARQLGERADAARIDVSSGWTRQLDDLSPSVVVNCCGPYVAGHYDVASTCLDNGLTYIDLADNRAFVNGFGQLDEAARKRGVTLITAASTVPTLSSAVVQHYQNGFSSIDILDYGISLGQKTERGLATFKSVLSYVGRPFEPYKALNPPVYGWQDLRAVDFPELGKRWLANCEIPDFDLLPDAYGIKKMRFGAGVELQAFNVALWAVSWLTRIGVPLKLENWAAAALRFMKLFDRFGTGDGGMYISLTGRDANDAEHVVDWFIIARDGYGPYIPAVPAVILARQVYRGEPLKTGAYAGLGLVSLEDYLSELGDLPIETWQCIRQTGELVRVTPP